MQARHGQPDARAATVFVIAHRLSTVRNSHVIYCALDHGNIIERGLRTDDLIAQRGEYYQLYTGAVELE